MDGSEQVLTDVAGEAEAAEDVAAPGAGPLRRRRWPKRVLVGVLAVGALLFAMYAAALYHVWSVSRHDQARPVDAIVVLGAAQYDGRPSPQLAARLDHALDLYQCGLAPRLFVTGGKQPADRFTEAQSEARYLQDRGVPATAILREDKGRTSWQSLSTVAESLHTQGLKSVLLVSDPYHMARIKGMAEELGLEAYGSPTTSSPMSGVNEFRHMLKEGAGVAVARVVGWDRLTSWTE